MLDGFQIEQEIIIQAPPDQVFDALTVQIGEWWHHRFEAGSTVSLEPKVGGRFYEDFGDGGGALFAVVNYLKRPEQVTMTGPMGMSGPILGSISFTLEAQEFGTVVKLSHKVIGEVSEEHRQGYSAGWEDLLGVRLKDFVEQGIKRNVS
jgi:uncharacterized protein YndB with AHSA1/START domain